MEVALGVECEYVTKKNEILTKMSCKERFQVRLEGCGMFKILHFSRNHLTGNISTELGLLSNLFPLSLQHNDLQGNIPEELSNISTLRSLQIEGNSNEERPERSNLASLCFVFEQATMRLLLIVMDDQHPFVDSCL